MKKIILTSIFLISSFSYAGGVSMGYSKQLSFHTSSKKECRLKIEKKQELKPIHKMIKI